MTAKPIRVSMVVLDIIERIDMAPPDDPAWGLRLCEETGYGTGTVYPALNKLLRAGWIIDRWKNRSPPTVPAAASICSRTTGGQRTGKP